VDTTLQPGIQAPDFSLPVSNQTRQISLREFAGQKIVLLFFPGDSPPELMDQLTKFQAKAADLEAQETRLLSISTTPPSEQALDFPVLNDSAGQTAANYGCLSPEGTIEPTVFVLDEEGLIRRVYEAAKYPHLPNPAMVLRALKKLAGVVKAPPVTAEDWQLGPAGAPVTIIEYADYECKPCGEAYRLLKEIIPTYGDQILWVHRHLPLRHSHPLAQQAAEAAEAAGAQGKFWEMHDRLFQARLALAREQLIDYAGEVGLDVEQFTRDLDDRRFKDAVNADFKAAVKNKIKLPPALFINRLPLEGPRTEAAIRATVDNLLACPAG
jgi:peroxiredoxin/protein-disulfide isomerase